MQRVRCSLALLLCLAHVGWSSALAAEASAPSPATGQRSEASAELGRRMLRTFAPREYGGAARNDSVVQAGNGLIYVANARMGVLEFDGVRWRSIPVGPYRPASSLAVDAGSGRVYVGANGDFGYLAPDALGRLRFVSLLEQVPMEHRGFAHVHRVVPTPHGVLFVTVKQIFSYNGRSVEAWAQDGPLYPVVATSGRLMALAWGRGLVERQGDAWLPVPGGDIFADDRLAALLPFPGGGDGEWLVVTRQRGLYRLADGVATPWHTALDAVMQGAMHGEVLAVSDGRLAFGTRDRGLLLMDAEGRSIERIGADDGLPEGAVHGMSPDSEGGLWLAMDSGLARVEVSGPLTRFNADDGLLGSVIDLVRHEGALFAATSRGLFRLRGGPGRGFERITGVDSARRLLSLPDQLLVAAADGVYEWRNVGLRPVIAVGSAIDLLADRGVAGRVFVSAPEQGVSIWQLADGTWRQTGVITGVRQPRTLWQDVDGALWVGQPRAAPLRVQLVVDARVPGAARIETFAIPPEAEGLNFNLWPVLGRLRAANGLGVFRLDAGSKRFVADADFIGLFEPNVHEFAGHVEVPGKGLAIARGLSSLFDTEMGWATRMGAGPYVWQGWPVAVPSDFILDILHADEDGTVWLGGEQGALRIDARMPAAEAKRDVLMREVRAGDGRLLFGGAGQPPGVELDYRENHLRFSFAAAHYADESSVRYRAEWVGEDAADAGWSNEAFRDVSNLHEGSYRLRVRARFADGSEARPVEYEFVVLPPWFRSVWAYAGYFLAALLLVWGLVQWRTHSIVARQRMVQMRLGMLQSQLEPHFMFNALNAIGALVRSSQEAAALHSISGLSGLLRYALVATRSSWTTIDEECGFVRDYLELQQLRFEARLRFEVIVDDEVCDAPCPVLLFQPLVENAVHHGIEPMAESGLISVVVSAEPAGVRVRICNSVGLEPSVSGHGLGLSSTRERLALVYRGAAEFNAALEERQFVVSFLLPDGMGSERRQASGLRGRWEALWVN